MGLKFAVFAETLCCQLEAVDIALRLVAIAEEAELWETAGRSGERLVM